MFERIPFVKVIFSIRFDFQLHFNCLQSCVEKDTCCFTKELHIYFTEEIHIFTMDLLREEIIQLRGNCANIQFQVITFGSSMTVEQKLKRLDVLNDHTP